MPSHSMNSGSSLAAQAPTPELHNPLEEQEGAIEVPEEGADSPEPGAESDVEPEPVAPAGDIQLGDLDDDQLRELLSSIPPEAVQALSAKIRHEERKRVRKRMSELEATIEARQIEESRSKKPTTGGEVPSGVPTAPKEEEPGASGSDIPSGDAVTPVAKAVKQPIGPADPVHQMISDLQEQVRSLSIRNTEITLMLFKNDIISEYGGEIIEEMVTGSTVEELRASAERAHETWCRYAGGGRQPRSTAVIQPATREVPPAVSSVLGEQPRRQRVAAPQAGPGPSSPPARVSSHKAILEEYMSLPPGKRVAFFTKNREALMEAADVEGRSLMDKSYSPTR